ncbi:TetR/AcrR family transcriptional regulator [Amaricoccus sp.]|uniref:TetR/AcrR family transcriptional regulator n=1 Tax=Amaricoccus sp. TaxID=1872485 RepID=UPI001B71BD9B|nr:TetR/AcrR family transcriptional regulator [Amaricoccus sp.]MBP7003216.1 TetR/AcrR family transcriptional regulator [Amaricoccus sp.]
MPVENARERSEAEATAPERGEEPARERASERKLAQVLAGAREVILAHGFQAASVDDIARAAGVSKATLYRYFPDKAALFAAVMSGDCAWRREIPVETEERALTAILADFARWTTEQAFSAEGQNAFRAALAESERFPALGEEFYRKVDGARRWLAPVIEAAAARGEIEVDDPDLAARRFLSLCRGDLFLRRLFCGAGAACEARIEQHVAEAVEGFLRIYRPAA